MFAFVDDQAERVGRFRLDRAAGLEDDIIATLRPDWNGGEAAAISTPPSLADAGDDGASETSSIEPINDKLRQPMDENPASALRPTFLVTLGQTYFNQGFFNVPVDFERFVGKDGEPIEILDSRKTRIVMGKINRSVNSNDVPRVMGGKELRDWIHLVARQGQGLRVIVHSTRQIEVSRD